MEFGAKGQRKNKALDVFKNFKGRHAGLVKALTTDVEEFFKQCDPEADLGFQERGTFMLEVSSLKLLPAQVKEKENLCLYGLPNEQWAVNLPADDSPPGLPEPVLGINFARDGMQLKEWLSFVAYHSDAWLLAVAFYAGARFGFSKAERKQLFDMINALPTIHEVVTGVPKTQQKEESTVSNQSKNKSKPNANKRALESRGKFTKLKRKYEEEEDEDEEDEDGWYIEKDVEEEQGESLCGTCGRKYEENEFWICCDTCETWFHGQCVKITAAAAEHRKLYKCPPCVSKRSRTRCTEY